MKNISLLWLAVMILYCHTGDTFTQTLLHAQAKNPVESGKRALQREDPFPWYDQPQDKLKRIPLDVEWIQQLRERMQQLEENGEDLREMFDDMIPDDLPDNFDPNEIPTPDMQDLSEQFEDVDFDSETFMKRWGEYLDRLQEERDANSDGSGRANPDSPFGDGDPANGNLDPSRGNSSSSRSPTRRAGDWSPDFEFAGSAAALVQSIFWIILAVLVIAGIGLIIWAIINRERTNKDPGLQSESKVVTEEQRLEELPVQLDPAYKNLLDRVRECYDAGDYNQAIIYLFSYQLIQLDKRQFIRLTRGKTNHQYLREIKQLGGLRDYLSVTVRAFEDVFFGNHDLTRQRFQQCWEHVDVFRSLTQPVLQTGEQM